MRIGVWLEEIRSEVFNEEPTREIVAQSSCSLVRSGTFFLPSQCERTESYSTNVKPRSSGTKKGISIEYVPW